VKTIKYYGTFCTDVQGVNEYKFIHKTVIAIQKLHIHHYACMQKKFLFTIVCV
jgi:hypothetical protein